LFVWRRLSLVKQADQSDCGAAALATIARYHRVPLSLQQIRDLAGTDHKGTNLLGLYRAAQDLGFYAQGVKGKMRDLGKLPLPAVAHICDDDNALHFVVLYQVGPRKVVVGDPARGLEKWTPAEFSRRWTGNLLLLLPEEGPARRAPGKVPPEPWQRFARLLRSHSGPLVEAFLCALLMTVLGVANSFFLQHLVDSVLIRNDVRLLNALGLGMIAAILFRGLYGSIRQYLLAYIGRKVDLALIAAYTRHILRLPLPFFEMRRIGEILSRILDAGKVREAISGTTLTILVDGTLVVLFLVVLWLYDMPLALAITAFVPLMILAVMAHHPASKRASRAVMEHASQMWAHLAENVSGVETIKAHGAEDSRADEGENRLVRVVQGLFSLQLLDVSMSSLATVLTGLAGLTVLWVGAYRVMSGALSIGELLFCYSLVSYMLGPLERLAGINLKIQDALVAVDRLFQIMDLEPEVLEDPHKIPFTGVRAAIVFQDASFSYGHRAPALQDICMRIPAGKVVAVVGESGSGKSTLLKLLLGFYRPTAGRVLIDGVDLGDYVLASLRSRVQIVSQDPFVFTGTIRENVALTVSHASLEQVSEAIRAAGLEEFVNSLPQRYETVIGERGSNLSGGQRQRLAIARALLSAPEVLIFDEATSHLDTATERVIQQNLRTLLAGKTAILVAHRLSTIKQADYIYILHQGRIVEEGTHRQLLDQKGRYEQLWRAQTEEANGDGSTGGLDKAQGPAGARG
jgi:ATP-binding cassette, subfamily C, bacteriocin exporter